ncbi:ATP-binding protein [bacterium]|nr:ATP-binding protein [bacterium]
MSKNFRLNVIFRVLLLFVAVFAVVYCLLFTRMYVVTFLVSMVLLGLLGELIRYVDKTNRDLASFLLSIRHDDYSTTFTDSRAGRSFSELYESLNVITDKFQEIRAEKETSFQYLQTVVRHVNVGLICFNEAGEVELMNNALKQLLGKPHINQVKGLNKVDPKLLTAIEELAPGERTLVKAKIGNELKQLAIQAAEFKLQDRSYRLISMQDIKGELEVQELEAWQKLIRILTHEIMNSVTPIVSLTSTIREMVNEDDDFTEMEGVEDLKAGLEAINKRSQGLLHFTEAYRDLTRIPTPSIQPVNIAELLERTRVLFTAELEDSGVNWVQNISDSSLVFQADPELIEQVLINLVQNALDVLKGQEHAILTVTASRFEEGKTHIRIMDNGPGISQDLIEQVFVPFFTTKSSGSGIGLSLSRQIMRMHKGSISVQSTEGVGTTFILVI